MKLSNVRRLVAPITYMVLDIDDMIDVDTSSGGLTTLYIPNISLKNKNGSIKW